MPFRQLTPALKAIVKQSSMRIFGELPVVAHRTGMKVLQQKPVGPLMMAYYNVEPSGKLFRRTMDPNYLTEQEDRDAQALNKLKQRGKGPPKKGQGRRASKNKGKAAAAASAAAAAAKKA